MRTPSASASRNVPFLGTQSATGGRIGEEMAVHLLSIGPLSLTALTGSGPVTLRHPKLTTYRCFLPDLTGFMALRRVGPGPQRCSAPPVPRYTNLE